VQQSKDLKKRKTPTIFEVQGGKYREERGNIGKRSEQMKVSNVEENKHYVSKHLS
jgi:hypothetical protein